MNKEEIKNKTYKHNLNQSIIIHTQAKTLYTLVTPKILA